MADLAAKREAPPLPQLNEEPPGVRAGRPPLPLVLRSSFPTFAAAHRRLAGCYSVPGDGAAGPCSARRGRTRMSEIVWGVRWGWAGMAVRWLHVVAGIAWIGSSFYFIALDLSLKQRTGLPEGAGGEAWQVHGGGFYNMVKYLVAPARLPDELTWFKWEAYTTWLSEIGRASCRERVCQYV